jgi:hypothetical protein
LVAAAAVVVAALETVGRNATAVVAVVVALMSLKYFQPLIYRLDR